MDEGEEKKGGRQKGRRWKSKRDEEQVSKREREIWVRGWTGRNIDPATSR